MKVPWSNEEADPTFTSEDDFPSSPSGQARISEQKIAANVTTLDGLTKGYDLGTAYGCTGKEMNEIENNKLALGKPD